MTLSDLISTFTLASVLCGASQTMGELICARLFQGLVGGVLAPMTQMMMARVAGKNMARVMGYASLPILLAPVLGPALAATILAHATWSWLFYLNVPVGILGVGLAVLMLPRDTASLQKRPFDFLGFTLICPSLAALIYGLQDATHAEGRWFLFAGAVFLGRFLRHSLRKGDAASCEAPQACHCAQVNKNPNVGVNDKIEYSLHYRCTKGYRLTGQKTLW